MWAIKNATGWYSQPVRYVAHVITSTMLGFLIVLRIILECKPISNIKETFGRNVDTLIPLLCPE